LSTKSELLDKLSREQLKEIAISEGLKIPEKASKDAIIKELLSLSMSRIREIVSEYTEEIERTTIIKEKIKRTGKMEKKEKTEMKMALSRAEIITSLMENKVKLHPSIIEEFGEKFRFHPETRGDIFTIYKAFPDEALKTVYDCFVENKLDERGRFLEYRFAQWMANKDKEITKIDIRKKIPNIGEIDVIGYNKDGKIISIAECKARRGKASKEDIDPWLRSIELIKNIEGSLKNAYFVNVAGFTPGIKERMLEDRRINEDGFFKIKTSLVKFTKEALIIGAKEGVNIYLCEERAGKIKQVFP
jgi:hypothetical protein